MRIAVEQVSEFAAFAEPGAEPLVGDADNALLPEGGDVMIYGDGGAGKTTLAIDLVLHLAAGRDWLGIPVPHPTRVLFVENEGPRPLLRRKLSRRLDAWDGETSGLVVLADPWAELTLASEQDRADLAAAIEQHAINVLVAGPLTRIGMDAAGTLQEVVEFVGKLSDLRARCSRPLTVVLIHHESKAGSVSGAWEGAGDTLLHVKGAGPGHTVVTVQKARWASEYHGQTLKLRWTDDGGFAAEVERDLVAEITELLSDGSWRTAEEIRVAVGAGKQPVRQALEDNPDRFGMLTGEQARSIGRSTKARLYGAAA